MFLKTCIISVINIIVLYMGYQLEFICLNIPIFFLYFNKLQYIGI